MGRHALLDVVSVNPTADGLGAAAEFTQKLINWGAQFALWFAVGSMLYGGAMWAWSQQGGPGYAGSRGRTFFIGGFVGAVGTALAAPVVNLLFDGATIP